MPPYRYDDDDVVVIVGSGAGGGTLANELCQKGVKVVVLEAGRHHTPDQFVNDEWRSFKQLAWLDNRTTSGSFRVAKDFPKPPRVDLQDRRRHDRCTGPAAVPRFMEHEFKASSYYDGVDGVNALDWPISLADIEPYYDRAEDKLGITQTTASRPCRRTTTTRCSPTARSASATSASTRPLRGQPGAARRPPGDDPGRLHFQGDKVGAKWSTLVAELPKAAATGRLDLRPQSHVIRIEHDAQGLVTGVTYIDGDGPGAVPAGPPRRGGGQLDRDRAAAAQLGVEPVPRRAGELLGPGGTQLHAPPDASVYAIFEQPVRMWRGETMAGHIEDEAPNDPSRGFVGGYYLQLLSLGVPFMAAFMDPGGWGRDFASFLEQYEHMAGMWLVGEDMPQESNRVTLNRDELDQYGQPVPNVHFDDHANDVAMREHAWQAGEALYQSVGAVRTWRTPPYPATHNIGTAR
jgi:hypothetical protein